MLFLIVNIGDIGDFLEKEDYQVTKQATEIRLQNQNGIEKVEKTNAFYFVEINCEIVGQMKDEHNFKIYKIKKRKRFFCFDHRRHPAPGEIRPVQEEPRKINFLNSRFSDIYKSYFKKNRKKYNKIEKKLKMSGFSSAKADLRMKMGFDQLMAYAKKKFGDNFQQKWLELFKGSLINEHKENFVRLPVSPPTYLAYMCHYAWQYGGKELFMQIPKALVDVTNITNSNKYEKSFLMLLKAMGKNIPEEVQLEDLETIIRIDDNGIRDICFHKLEN